MKKVINNPLLKTKITEALNLLCDNVSQTLGPKGHNIIIDHSDFTPFITNDGATIAENISSDDPITNTILELAKEASLKTNDNVGDGTTTTLVLLKNIYESGIKMLKSGLSGQILKEELKSTTESVIKNIKKKSKKPTLSNIRSLASIAASDISIGKILTNAYQKVGAKSIYLIESSKDKTTVTHMKGYIFETIFASPYYLKNNETLTLSNALLFLTSSVINYSAEISEILNYSLLHNLPLIIIAKDYSDLFINEQISNYLEHKSSVYLLKTPGYGYSEINILEDLATICHCQVLNNLENIDISNLGQIISISINSKDTILKFNPSTSLEKLILNLKQAEPTPENLKRLSMLTEGLITINIGAPTDTERREKKMRYEDALCAIKSADSGIIPGGGLILYELASKLNNNSPSNLILKEALTKPLITILKNADLDIDFIIKKIVTQNFTILYNVTTNKFENISSSSVIDSTSVVINSLKNAVSIASLLLTTSTLVINELPKKNIKEDFNEI